MRRRSRVLVATAPVVLGLIGLAGPPAVAQHQHPQPANRPGEASAHAARDQELKVGKSDDVSFSEDVRVGETLLKPGTYRVQHRVAGGEHFVHFEALATTTPSAHKTATGTAIPAGGVGDVKCRLEPLAARAQATSLHLSNEDGSQRLTKLLVRGENVAHVF